MSIWSTWVASIVGVGILLLIPLVVALMANTAASRITQALLEAHEGRLDKPVMVRKEETRQRLSTEREWDRASGYRRTRNVCLLIVLAVLEINVVSAILVFFRLSPVLLLSIIVVAIIGFIYCAYVAHKERPRPEWVTTPDYYRNLTMGD